MTTTLRRAGENLTCPGCGGRIRRGEPIQLRGHSWGHPACLPLAPVAGAVRPYLRLVKAAS